MAKFTLEVKAVGTPRHAQSQRQRAIGRPGSADLAKRVKEVAFKTIDLKAEYGRIMAGRGQAASAPGGNLTSWLRSVPPTAYLFIGARVVSDRDRAAAEAFARTAGLVLDGVGLFCFAPVSEAEPTTYRRVEVATDIGLDRVLYRACQDLLRLRTEAIEPVDPREAGPAVSARDVLAEVVEEDGG